MNPISVIIIAKNEAENIIECILSAQQISNDIIIADSGSTDNTQALALQNGARILQITWKGYGQTRNEAGKIAANNWIFALDADERITENLANHINNLTLNNKNAVFGFKRENFFATKKIKFGQWGRDKIYRLYNRQNAHWNLMLVHENVIGDNIEKKMLAGSVLHYTMKDIATYQAKSIFYAQLSAQKYFEQGKKASEIKKIISPVFSFIQNYIFRFGFLDGKDGFTIAYIAATHNFNKYKFLNALFLNKKKLNKICKIVK